ncbi:MAG: NADH-quinone oxidoreductase subunit NuoH [Deltaproteobacteria bacterium]|nr:NADH-quinone oxidoreductase subunit NuoH [Deltaproteobacteria bacterium]
MPAPTPLTELVPNIWLALGLAVAAIMGYLTVNAMMLVWLERKVSARFQRRLGPTEVGFAGLLQSVVDIIKLLSKQIITPRLVDKPLFLAAPIVVFLPVMAGVSLFPISRNWVLHDFNVGLILVFTFGGLGLLGIFMAGWSSNNKYALLGAMRAVAQAIAYEIPLILAALSVVLMARSMSLVTITEAQRQLPFVVLQPVAFLIYLIAGVAETNRAPFDIPEAESELVAGFHTEYSGMGFALFMLSEYSNLIVVAMVATTLFLGGYLGPGQYLGAWGQGIPLLAAGPHWFFLKAYFVIFLVMWFRWTFPRLRFDQLMNFAWIVLIPLAIANLLVTAVVMKVVP